MHALKPRNYPGADRLHTHNHNHKWAFIPFLKAVSRAFESKEGMKTWKALPEIDNTLPPDERKLQLRIAMTDLKVHGIPVPPLNFKFEQNGKAYDFSLELADIAKAANLETVNEYIRKLANKRNKVLYAGQDGIPSVESDMTPEVPAPVECPRGPLAERPS